MPVQQDKTLPISYDRAAELIKKIGPDKITLEGHPVLNNNAGGTFRSKDIEDWVFDDQVKGLMFWYCLDGDDFFLALEPWKKDYDDSDIRNKRPACENLLVPKKLLKENLYNREYLKEELPTYRDGVANSQKFKDRITVTGWVNNYVNFMITNYNQEFSPFAFFVGWENDINYLRDFFQNKNPRNLRYFFCYDEVEMPYSLRIILVPVNRFGVNIRGKKGKFFLANDALQYSWPPKPATET